MSLLIMAAKLFIGVFLLILLMRILGRKELSSIGPLDIVFAVALGDFIGDAVYEEKVKIYEMTFVLVVWSIIILLTDWLSYKSNRITQLVEGEPQILIYKGEVNKTVQKKNRLTDKEIEAMLREKGVFNLDEVTIALLETNGELSVTKD